MFEHYEMYEEIENKWTSRKDDQEILQENQEKDWFVKKMRWVAFDKNDSDKYFAIDETQIPRIKKEGKYEVGQIIDRLEAQNCLILYTDEGKKFQFWAPWCGHFERLNLAEIIVDEPRKKYKPRR